MGKVFQAYFHMCQRARLHKLFIHIGFKCQFLNINIMAKRYESFAPVIRAIIGVLHRGQHAEHRFMFAHE